ncbi:7 transmembrane receptor [Trichuris suis]|nr:7 transmembrane receptor [Trichuris suis]
MDQLEGKQDAAIMISETSTETPFNQNDTLGDGLVVAVWTIASFYGLLTNILVLLAIARHSTIRYSVSYWMMASLSVCDIVMLLLCLWYVIPSTFWHEQYMSLDCKRNIVGMFIYNVFWYTGVVQLAAVAVNRLVSIMYPISYKRLFSKFNTAVILTGCYVLGLSVSIPALFPCCYTIYNHYIYVTMYVSEDTMYFIVDAVVNSLSLVTMAICYGAILMRVRRSHQSTKKHITGAATRQLSNREMRLFIQFSVVSLVFAVTFVTWQWLPRISVSKWIYFVTTSLFFVNNCINPTIYLIFNSLLRQEIFRLICCWQKVVFVNKRNVQTGNTSSDEAEAVMVSMNGGTEC